MNQFVVESGLFISRNEKKKKKQKNLITIKFHLEEIKILKISFSL